MASPRRQCTLWDNEAKPRSVPMSQSAEFESPPEKKPPSADVPPSSEPETAAEGSFSELLDQFERRQEKPAYREGGVLTGTVVSVRDDGVFVDIGRKSEAFLPLENRSEKDEDPELRVGNSVDISITGRSPDGYLLLSRVIAERPQNWAQFEWAFSTGAAVAGTVTETIKGGLAVDVGVRAFMPRVALRYQGQLRTREACRHGGSLPHHPARCRRRKRYRRSASPARRRKRASARKKRLPGWNLAL